MLRCTGGFKVIRRAACLAPNKIVQTRGIKNRRPDTSIPDPDELVSKFIKKMNNVPRLDDVDEGTSVIMYSKMSEKLIKEYEEDKKRGYIPMRDIMEEEPSAKPFVDFLSRKKPQFGEYSDRITRRCGALGIKVGMTRFWDSYWKEHALTIVHIPECQVVQVKDLPKTEKDKEKKLRIQVGAMPIKAHKCTKPLLGHFAKCGVPPKRALHEFKITSDAVLPVGFEIKARHYVPGQLVDVTGMTKGKGFQGVMKRWGFRGQPQSHGTSVSHRSPGSIGNRIGKIWPGKKMAGHMGARRRTVHNVRVFMIDPVHNLVYLKGQVPATQHGLVIIRDAFRKMQKMTLPMPSFIPDPKEVLEGDWKNHLLRWSGTRPIQWDAEEYTEEIARKIEKSIWEKKYGPNRTPWDMPIIPRPEPLDQKLPAQKVGQQKQKK